MSIGRLYWVFMVHLVINYFKDVSLISDFLCFLKGKRHFCQIRKKGKNDTVFSKNPKDTLVHSKDIAVFIRTFLRQLLDLKNKRSCFIVPSCWSHWNSNFKWEKIHNCYFSSVGDILFLIMKKEMVIISLN